jgi:hypothetical protein
MYRLRCLRPDLPGQRHYDCQWEGGHQPEKLRSLFLLSGILSRRGYAGAALPGGQIGQPMKTGKSSAIDFWQSFFFYSMAFDSL